MFNARGFDQFWACFPRKVGKLAAQKIWNRLKPDDELVGQMLTAIGWQRATRQWREGYVPHPKTWLSQGRWMDEPDQPLRLHLAEECRHEPRCETRWRCHQRTQI